MSKFVQIQAVTTKDGHSLYALDDEGHCWIYDGNTKAWLALSKERMTPQAVGHTA